MMRRPSLSRSTSSDMVLRKRNRGGLEQDQMSLKASDKNKRRLLKQFPRPMRPSSPFYLGF
eukprot:132543-Amphidinium_carterae.1